MTDVIRHPHHYGIGRFTCECIDITRHLSFNAGNAFKYVFRHAEKNGVQDVNKAELYLRWAIDDGVEPWLPGKRDLVRDLVAEHIQTPLQSGEHDPVYGALVEIGMHGNYETARILTIEAIHRQHTQWAAA